MSSPSNNIIVYFVRFFNLPVVLLSAPTCDVSHSSRYECGWLGINEQTCLKRGCCWDDSAPNAKFCYVKGNTRKI